MSTKDIANAKNADLRASQQAMQRAAELARHTAIQTGTDLIIVQDGKTVRIPASVLQDTAQTSSKPSP